MTSINAFSYMHKVNFKIVFMSVIPVLNRYQVLNRSNRSLKEYCSINRVTFYSISYSTPIIRIYYSNIAQCTNKNRLHFMLFPMMHKATKEHNPTKTHPQPSQKN